MLAPISVAAPGFYGLNTQRGATLLEPGWATVAKNCVIDQSGRLASRKGRSDVTASAISGTPDVEQIHDYVNTSGTSEIISAAGSKIYSGTTTLTDKTGTLTVTADNWQFQNFNGNVIGFQASHNPIIYTGSGNATELHSEISDWAASTSYTAGDVVKKVSAGDMTIYMHCTTTGTSGGSEPSWNTTVGATTTDNTVTWTTREFPKRNICLAAYGFIWVADETTINYSDLLLPYKFSGGSSGSLNLKSVWTYGMDEITALAAYNGHLIIFGKETITIYSGADDPTTMTLVEQIRGVGCVARDSIQDIGTDLFFLSDTGVRSLRRTIQEKSMPLNDVSKNVRDLLLTYVKNETLTEIRSAYYEPDGFYILTLPTAGLVYCFDVRSPLEDGSARVTDWDCINPKALCVARDSTLYMGHPGVISKYDGYLDNTSTYILDYRGPWLNMDSQSLKIPKRIRLTVNGGNGYTVTFRWAFDYNEQFTTSAVSITSSTSLAEYNIAEYNIAEYSGGDYLSTVSTNMSKTGEVIKFGFAMTINGNSVSIQKVDMYVKQGRMNR